MAKLMKLKIDVKPDSKPESLIPLDMNGGARSSVR
jgi:hypothetical protein